MRHPETHGGHGGTLGLVTQLYRTVSIPYTSLFGTSVAVRYHGQQTTQADYEGTLMPDFNEIRRWAGRKLQDQGRTSLPGFLTNL
jgi:hypothetical protein